MSYQSEIESLLIDLDFKEVVWNGALRMMGSRERIAWDVDFVDWDDETFCDREFILGSNTRIKMQRIIELFQKMHCAIGTAIYLEPHQRVAKYGKKVG